MDEIRAILAPGEGQTARLGHLAAIGPPPFAVLLPSPDDLPPLLLDLAVPHEEIDPLVALLPTIEDSAGLRWLLGRCVHSLVRTMGQIDGPPGFPALGAAAGPLQRLFDYVVFIAALPHLRAFYAARNIPDDILRQTLADLGRSMALHRRAGRDGWRGDAFWPMLHFRGALFALGRLQFQRVRLGERTGRAIAALGQPYGPGDPALAVHIPALYGPITPTACDASFARARPFFAAHFPEESYAIAVCHSWLLDQQLADYLPTTSNILHFQRRFAIVRQLEADDLGMARFIYGRSTPDLSDLPRRTTLERAFATHLDNGGHWHGGAGWCLV